MGVNNKQQQTSKRRTQMGVNNNTTTNKQKVTKNIKSGNKASTHRQVFTFKPWNDPRRQNLKDVHKIVNTVIQTAYQAYTNTIVHTYAKTEQTGR